MVNTNKKNKTINTKSHPKQSKETKVTTNKEKIKSSDYGIIGLIKENKGILPIFQDFNNDFIKNFPKERDAHFFGHTYTYRRQFINDLLGFYTDLYEFLDISQDETRSLEQYHYKIALPNMNRTIDAFKNHAMHFSNYLEETDKEIMVSLKKLSKIECLRLNEAMKCLQMNCNLACVVMAVSAVEYRLHKLLQKANKRLYESEFKTVALGGIVELFRRNTRYVGNKYNKFKKVLPEKHLHIMESLNTYRIFSAHPKEEQISTQTAKAILSFSFILLVDPLMKTQSR